MRLICYQEGIWLVDFEVSIDWLLLGEQRHHYIETQKGGLGEITPSQMSWLKVTSKNIGKFFKYF